MERHIFLSDSFRSKCARAHFDRLGKREVHSHLKAGARDLHGWIEDYGIPPHLKLDDTQAEDFAALGEATDRSPNQLLREAVSLLLAKNRAATPPRT